MIVYFSPPPLHLWIGKRAFCVAGGVCDPAALAGEVYGSAAVSVCGCCIHGSEEGCRWLLLPQSTHE